MGARRARAQRERHCTHARGGGRLRRGVGAGAGGSVHVASWLRAGAGGDAHMARVRRAAAWAPRRPTCLPARQLRAAAVRVARQTPRALAAAHSAPALARCAACARSARARQPRNPQRPHAHARRAPAHRPARPLTRHAPLPRPRPRLR
jgi:hypothetical protein